MHDAARNPSDNALRLLQVIDDLSELSGRFHDVLTAEQAALAQWPLQGLPEITRAKLLCARELEAVETRRQQVVDSLIGSHAEGTAADCMAQAIACVDQGANLLTRWLNALSALRQCHEQNRVNGLTIGVQSRQTQHSLEILGASIGLPVIYDRHGQSGPGRLHKHLARA